MQMFVCVRNERHYPREVRACPLGVHVSSRWFSQAIPVAPPRPASAAATEHRSAGCLARTFAKSASEPRTDNADAVLYGARVDLRKI